MHSTYVQPIVQPMYDYFLCAGIHSFRSLTTSFNTCSDDGGACSSPSDCCSGVCDGVSGTCIDSGKGPYTKNRSKRDGLESPEITTPWSVRCRHSRGTPRFAQNDIDRGAFTYTLVAYVGLP